jgi:hypothetical protein
VFVRDYDVCAVEYLNKWLSDQSRRRSEHLLTTRHRAMHVHWIRASGKDAELDNHVVEAEHICPIRTNRLSVQRNNHICISHAWRIPWCKWEDMFYPMVNQKQTPSVSKEDTADNLLSWIMRKRSCNGILFRWMSQVRGNREWNCLLTDQM